MIENIDNVFIYVKDQIKAKEFWVNKLNFSVKHESKLDSNNYWLEVCPKYGSTTLVLYPESLNNNNSKSIKSITFFTKNIYDTYNELSEKGVKFLKKPEDLGYGIFAEFCDEDNNIFSLKQA